MSDDELPSWRIVKSKDGKYKVEDRNKKKEDENNSEKNISNEDDKETGKSNKKWYERLSWSLLAGGSSPQEPGGREKQDQEELKLQKELRNRDGRGVATKVVTWTKRSALTFFALSTIYSFCIFAVGLVSIPGGRAIVNLFFKMPEIQETPGFTWQTYLLILSPASLMAVLGIILWITGMRFASNFYSEKSEKEENLSYNELLNFAKECVKSNDRE